MTDTHTTALIPDEAVQAANLAYCRTMDATDDFNASIRSAIIAALPYLSAPCVDKPADDSMTQKEIQLENLKQMAKYDGKVISLEFRDPYYLASCDNCGWVGSSELCGTDSFGDDSDVYCPRCQSGGADCGKVAERITCKPVDVAAVRKQAFEEGFENAVEQSLNAIDRHDDTTRQEALNEIKAMKPDYRALSSAEPAQGEQWQPIETVIKDFRKFVDLIEGRAMACDGPVTPFLEELKAASDSEQQRFIEILGKLYRLKLPAAPTTEAGK